MRYFHKVYFMTFIRRFYSTVDDRQLFNELGKKIGIKKYEDWYNFQTADLVPKIGTSFFQYKHDGSLFKALNHIYPEYPWLPWKFIRQITRRL
jgi:hypothetical protein